MIIAKIRETCICSSSPRAASVPGGYPAQPGLIRLSVRPSICTCLQIRYSAENGTGPTDSVNYSLKSWIHVNRESAILQKNITLRSWYVFELLTLPTPCWSRIPPSAGAFQLAKNTPTPPPKSPEPRRGLLLWAPPPPAMGGKYSIGRWRWPQKKISTEESIKIVL